MKHQVVIPHGTTPNRVGVVLVEIDGKPTLRLTSPCCGELFREGGQSTLDPKWSISAWCSGVFCELEWTRLMFDCDAVLYFDCELSTVSGSMSWLGKALGIPARDLQVTVE